ncbi:MAG: lysine--tRNA ligase [Actinomycetota bacterium]|nr:lysine--tRNA ligase [Actinomycetota bacterium]
MTESSPPYDDRTPDHLPLADHPLTADRLAKLDALRRAGLEPYPARFERDSLTAEVQEAHAGLPPDAQSEKRVSIAGRLMAMRSHGRLTFAELQDRAGRLQLFVDQAMVGEQRYSAFLDLDLGDWVGVAGEVITTRRGELSVRVEEFVLLAKALRPLPEKWHGLRDVEQRHRRRYLDLVVNPEARRVVLIRARVVSELRRQFEQRGFIEVETPILQVEPGGALARPFATHHHALDIDMYLRIATELHLKRLVIGGLERVFELGRIFRNEGMDRTHNPEFTTLEAYQALADYHDMMALMEEVFPAVAKAVTGGTEITYQGRPLDLAPPYRRLRMVDLVAEATGGPVRLDRPVEEVRELARRHGIEPKSEWGTGRLVAELFEELVASTIWEPTFVMDHPKEISPLARTHRRDSHLVERFELFVAGREYCDAFSELIDPLEQRRRFEEQAQSRADGESHPVDEDFLQALEYGMPPSGGLGIGVDRLVMLLADQPSIREVILFPQMRPE